MAIGRTNAGGTGGAELNFTVVPGLTQPVSAQENTIWVKTEKLNSYYFSPNEPENMADYDVWFSTGTSSTVEFNALKKNGIQVYPISAVQRINGALVDVTAKSYQSGEWVDWWNGELYKNGNEYNFMTGGWVGKALRGNQSGTDVEPKITRNTSNIVASVDSSTGGGVLHTSKKIDLTKYKTITFKGTLKGSSAYAAVGLGVWSSFGTYWKSAAAINYVEGAKTITDGTLDVSGLSGEYYVGFGLYVSASATITEVILK